MKKYFWGDALRELNWGDHQKYIIQTLLEKGNEDAIHWLFKMTNRSEIKQLLPELKLSPKSANFWKIYLA